MTDPIKTTEEAIKGLTHYNSWRLGGDSPMPDPKDITAWINTAIQALKDMQKPRRKS